MKVLFILNETNTMERLGVMQLSSALKDSGFDVKLAVYERLDSPGINNVIKNYLPDVIGYSVMTGEHKKIVEINKALKERYKFLSVFGGPHPTFFQDLIKEESCDAICIGEADAAFPEFCRRLEYGKAYWETPNFIVKYNGQTFNNPLSPLIDDLDKLPFPDRQLMYEADPELLNDGKKIFFSSRGCPYGCSYCFNKKYNDIYKNKGHIVRYRSPENLIAEIDAVREKYPLNIIYIADDIFILKPKRWFEQFSKMYKEKIKLPLTCHIRANLVTEENIALLKEAGLDSVWMGIECGDEDIANNVLSRGLRNEQLMKAAKLIKKYKIKLITQNLLGLPVPDSFQADLRTLDFNIKIKPAFAWSSILYPYPGTPINVFARQKGFIGENIVFLETNKRTTALDFSKKEKRKIENLHKLFGLIVQFPCLRHLVNFIVIMPLGEFYRGLFYFWYGYNFKFRFYPFRSIKKELPRYIRLWWKLVKKE